MRKSRLNSLNSSKNESIKTPQLPGITSLNLLKPCKNLDHLETTNLNYHSTNNLMLLNRNIRGLNNKTDKSSNFTSSNPPQVLSISEHNLKSYQLDSVLIQSYNLSVKFCKNIFKNGGVCIYTHD